jgi:hypothetical protein
MTGMELLAERLAEAGFAVAELAARASGSGSSSPYTWPEVDLAALWCPPRPPAAERFFDAYGELARPFDGWRDQAQLLRIWDLFSVVAHGLDTWGAAGIIRKVIAPFR